MTVLRCLLCLFVLTCPEFAICAQTVVITFDVPGSLGTFPESINKNGDVAGYYLDTSLQHRGFLRRVNGVLTTFDVPGSLSTDPVSIGVEGQITGSYEDTVTVHGFLRQPDGSITTFDGTDSTETHPRAISASGLITGYFFDAIGVHGFLRERNGTMTPFDVPGTFPITYPQAINRAGQITGFSFDQPGVSGRGFVRERDGSFSRPFDSQTYPVAINADGRVTGYFGDNTRSGFVSQPDGAEVFFDVVTPPLLSVPVAIDHSGRVAGWYYNINTNCVCGFLRKQDGSFITFSATSTASETIPTTMYGSFIAGNYSDDDGRHGFIRDSANISAFRCNGKTSASRECGCEMNLCE